MIQNTWNFSCTWWHTLVTPVVKRQGQEDPSLIKDSLDYIGRPCLPHSSCPSLRQKTCLELWRQAFESSCIPRHLWLLSWVLCTDKESWFQESAFKQSCQKMKKNTRAPTIGDKCPESWLKSLRWLKTILRGGLVCYSLWLFLKSVKNNTGFALSFDFRLLYVLFLALQCWFWNPQFLKFSPLLTRRK